PPSPPSQNAPTPLLQPHLRLPRRPLRPPLGHPRLCCLLHLPRQQPLPRRRRRRRPRHRPHRRLDHLPPLLTSGQLCPPRRHRRRHGRLPLAPRGRPHHLAPRPNRLGQTTRLAKTLFRFHHSPSRRSPPELRHPKRKRNPHRPPLLRRRHPPPPRRPRPCPPH